MSLKGVKVQHSHDEDNYIHQCMQCIVGTYKLWYILLSLLIFKMFLFFFFFFVLHKCMCVGWAILELVEQGFQHAAFGL